MLKFYQKVKTFSAPTQLPDTEKIAESWQEQNRHWWQNNPMRYDWGNKIFIEEFSREFYQEIDKRFFYNASEYLKQDLVPFNELAHFKNLKNKDVLEIGVGNGSHAQLLATYARSFTGIDLTDYAVESTTRRVRVFNLLNARIVKMDAEKLDFPDGSFDFIWSWGVIHHSSNTRNILEEMYRVLRPNGRAVIMVYHRGWWNYYTVGFLRAFFSGDLFRAKSLHGAIQLRTDGAIARYYSFSDWKKLVKNLFFVENLETRGPKSDFILLPDSHIKRFLVARTPNGVCRFLTKNVKMGTFLVSTLYRN